MKTLMGIVLLLLFFTANVMSSTVSRMIDLFNDNDINYEKQELEGSIAYIAEFTTKYKTKFDVILFPKTDSITFATDEEYGFLETYIDFVRRYNLNENVFIVAMDVVLDEKHRPEVEKKTNRTVHSNKFSFKDNDNVVTHGFSTFSYYTKKGYYKIMFSISIDW